jgi:hypothetical protein
MLWEKSAAGRWLISQTNRHWSRIISTHHYWVVQSGNQFYLPPFLLELANKTAFSHKLSCLYVGFLKVRLVRITYDSNIEMYAFWVVLYCFGIQTCSILFSRVISWCHPWWLNTNIDAEYLISYSSVGTICSC